MGIQDTKFVQTRFEGGLNLNEAINENELQECTNCNLDSTGKIKPAFKDSKIVSGSNIDSIAGADGNIYYNIGTELRRYVASTGVNSSLGTIGASSKLKALKWNRGFSIIMASDALYKDIGGSLSSLGTTDPTTAPTVALVAQKTLQIETFEDHTEWTATALNKADDAVNFKEGTQSVKISPTVADQVGYMTKASVLDLSQYADGTTSPDDDYISVSVYVDNPEQLIYVQIFFDINTANFKNDMYWKTIPVLPVANNQALNEETPETWDDIIRQKQSWDKEWDNYQRKKAGRRIAGRKTFSDKLVYNETTGQYSFPGGFNPDYVEREKLKQLGVINKKLEDRASPHNDTWTTVKIRKSDFVREGIDATKTWADVAALKVSMLALEPGPAVEVSIDDLKLIGGGKLDNERYSVSYSYVSRYTLPDGSTYNEESSLSPEAEVTAAEAQNIVITGIADSAESQVTHKNVWIRGGGLFSRHLVGTIAQGVTTITTDKTEVGYVTEPLEDVQFNVGAPTSPSDIAKTNGTLFVAQNSRVYSSAPLIPAAFAGDAFLAIQGPVTGIMPKTSNLAVMQKHEEKILVNPGRSLSQGAYFHEPEFPQGCLSSRSTQRGFYSTEEGIAYFTGAAPEIISDRIREELVAGDLSNAVGAWNKGSYFLCLPAQQVMYEYDTLHRRFLKHDGIKDVTATNGALYVLKSDGIYIFEGDTTGTKAFAFRTPELTLPDDHSYNSIVVDGYMGPNAVTVGWYVDNSAVTTKSFTTTSRKTNRVPVDKRHGNRISVRISGPASTDTNRGFYSISVQGGK